MSELPPEERVIDFDGRDADREEDQQREAGYRKEQRRAVLYRMLSDPAARGWLWELLQEFGTFRMIFEASPTGFPDPQGTMYHLGRKSAGERIWRELDDAFPEMTSIMRREHG